MTTRTPPDGLIPLNSVGAALLKHTGHGTDPVAAAKTRYRLIWTAVTTHPELGERIGWRWFVRSDRKALDALASALGLAKAVPTVPRARRAAVSSPQGVAA